MHPRPRRMILKSPNFDPWDQRTGGVLHARQRARAYKYNVLSYGKLLGMGASGSLDNVSFVVALKRTGHSGLLDTYE